LIKWLGLAENQPAMENGTLIDDALKNDLTALYSAPERHYHGLAHVETLLGLAREYRALLSDPEAIEAAIWFHDAVYDTRRSDNEARSAELAGGKLAGRVEPGRLDRIEAMIRATAMHRVPDFEDEHARRDTALLLDMDLSILGAVPEVFDAYEQGVRREFAWEEEEAWRTGRSTILRGFLSRPRIFHTDEFRERFEKQARENIERSIRALERER
jgi:predicted metal-dependent HD superfamily phosphohydrolase